MDPNGFGSVGRRRRTTGSGIMCNEKQVENWAKAMVSRRQFGLAAGASAAVGSLAGCTTMGGTGALTEYGVDPDRGRDDGRLLRPPRRDR